MTNYQKRLYRTTPATGKNLKGFTLMELLMVVFLITIILSLSAFFFAGFLPASQFNATGREISAALQRTRSLARLNMQSQSFTIDLDNRSYESSGTSVKYIPAGISIKVIDPFSGEISHGKHSIIFNPTGSMAGGTIILSQKKRLLYIELDPVTGALATRVKP